MTADADRIAQYWGREHLAEAILTPLTARGVSLDALTVDALAPVDQFHGGGKPVTGRLARLAAIRPGTRVLDVGGGFGGPARTLAVEFGCHVTGIDLTDSYVRAAKVLTARMGLDARVTHQVGDALALPFPDGAFDLVWSNLALVWVEDPPAALRELHRVLAPGGLLMFSSYGPDTLRELRSAFSAASPARRVHSFADMHDVGDALVACGFALPVMDVETITLTYSRVEDLVRDLRVSGQTCAAADRSRALTGRGTWQRMLAAYENERKNGRLRATIEIVYGHAWKGDRKSVV